MAGASHAAFPRCGCARQGDCDRSVAPPILRDAVALVLPPAARCEHGETESVPWRSHAERSQWTSARTSSSGASPYGHAARRGAVDNKVPSASPGSELQSAPAAWTLKANSLGSCPSSPGVRRTSIIQGTSKLLPQIGVAELLRTHCRLTATHELPCRAVTFVPCTWLAHVMRFTVIYVADTFAYLLGKWRHSPARLMLVVV
jgi:hypothetical protein